MKSALSIVLSLAFVLSLSIIISSCSGPGYSVSKDDETGKHIIVGELSWNQWQKSASWNSYVADGYIPTASNTDFIATEYSKGNLDFIIVGASWCHDSELGMPEIIEILRLANVPFEKIKIFGVDKNKVEPTGYATSVNIEKVPTLIIIKNGKELGRIIEKPRKSWEQDIVDILKIKIIE